MDIDPDKVVNEDGDRRSDWDQFPAPVLDAVAKKHGLRIGDLLFQLAMATIDPDVLYECRTMSVEEAKRIMSEDAN